MTLKKSVIIIATIVATAGVAIAQDPISLRQESMKTVGGAARDAGNMLKGAAPFDAAKALDIFQRMNDVSKVYATYFPEGTETGGDTEASPKIWEDKAGFEAAVAKFEADTAAAIAAAPADLDAFKVSFGAVAANCGTCHKAYRVSNN